MAGKQAAQLIQPDATQLGDCDLLRLIIKELLPLSDDERRAVLDECSIDGYDRRLIWEELHPELVTTPCWQWAGEIAAQSATSANVLVKLRRGDKP